MVWQRLQTEQLIDKLVADLRPGRVENRIHALLPWMTILIVLPPLLLVKPLRADLVARWADPIFVTSFATSTMVFATGLLALWIVRVSWRSRLWLHVPLIAFGFWFVFEIASVAVDVFREGWRAFAFESSPQCPLVIGAVGAPVFLVLLALSRVGVVVWRVPTIAVAALTAFSLPATVLNLFHGLDNGAMILLWHLGAVAVFTVAAVSILEHRRLVGV